jgi:aminobenzoyl-glutamate utilization protein B
MIKEKAWNWIEQNKERIIEISDQIRGFAELGLVEINSSQVIAKELESHNFKVDMNVAGMPTAFVATFGSGNPIIGIMGEYDALAGLSQKKTFNREPLKEGAPGHGCGHNIHGVSGMAAAIALRYAIEKENLNGVVTFFGTPAEENYSGKVFMVRDGFFDTVDACLSHHPGSINTARLSSSNAVNGVKFHYHGKTSHAAGNPEQGRSALDAIELMNLGVNFLREHVIDEARIHYVIEDGGGQPNVVPDYARSWYYIRAPERGQLEPIYERILKIARGAALMTETELKIEFIDGLYNKIPNKILSEIVINNMRQIGAPSYSENEHEFAAKIAESISRQEKIESLRRSKIPNYMRYIETNLVSDIIDPWDEGETSPGSSDVGDVSWHIPTMEFSTATFVLGVPGHSWQHTAISVTSIGHKSLVFAAKTMVGAAIDLITKPELLFEAKKELKSRLKGQSYKCPIPSDVQPPLETAKKTAERLQKNES